MKQHRRLPYVLILLSWIFCASSLEAQNAILLDSLLQSLDEFPSTEANVDTLNHVSTSLWFKDAEGSKRLAKAALASARDIAYKRGIAEALKNLGVLNRRAENLGEALVYLEECYELFEELQDHSNLIDLNIGMSTIYRNMGEPDKAMTLLLEGTRLAIEHKPEELARLKTSIGNLFFSQDAFKEAKKHYLEVTPYYEEMIKTNQADSGDLIINFCDLGLVCAHLKEFQEGANYLKIAEKYFQNRNSQINLANIYSLWGEFYTLKGEMERALNYQHRAVKIFEEREKIRKLAGEYSNLGETYIKLEKYNEALTFLKKGAARAAEGNNLEYEEIIENQLFRVYEKMGETDLALKHLKDYLNVSQQIYNEKNAQAIQDKNAQYRTEVQEYQIEILEKDMKIKDAENSLKTTQLYGALGVGAFIFIFSVILLVLYERRRRDQQLILAQNEEIMDHQDEILRQKDELIQAKDIIHHQEIVEYEQKKQLEINRAWIEGEEQERERLAGELHDQVGSMLSTVKLHLQALEARVEKLNDETSKQFEFTNNLLDKACQTVRNLSHEVSSGMVSRYGLVMALEELVENTALGAPFELNLVIFDLEERLSKEVELNLYRIIQELLNNIIKYAEPEEVSISVTRHEDSLNIMVEDDGKGFDVSEARARGGLGFRNIETRLNKIGGSWHIDSGERMGTTVVIDVPIV